MSTLLIQAAGAGIGFLVGGPQGAQWGWAIGGVVGQAFAPPQKLPPQFGPRLGELKIQAATYGLTIPRIYGTARIAGNVIWADDILETATTTTVSQGGGGKGGGGGAVEQQQTTYSYSQSFGVGLCEGEIFGIRKVWANGKLIYDLAEDASSGTVLASFAGMTVYTGSETQSPSALQESIFGTGNVPGYRGLAYVEFEDLQLAPFGNRTPNLEFEVVVEGSSFDVTSETSIYDGGAQTSGIRQFDPTSNVFWSVDSSALTPLIAVSLSGTPTTLLSRTMSAGEKMVPWWVDSSGNLYGWNYNGGFASSTLRKITPAGAITNLTSNLSIFPVMAGNDPAVAFDAAGNAYFVDATAATLYRAVISGSTVTLTALSSSANRFIAFRGGDIVGRIYWWSASAFGYYDTGSLSPTVVASGGSYSKALLDAANRVVYVGGSADPTKLYQYTADGGVLASTITLAGNTGFNDMALDGLGYLYVHGTGNKVYRVDVSSFTVVATLTVTHTLVKEHALNGVAAMTVNISASQFEIFTLYGAELITAQSGDLASIVSDLCQLSALTAGDIDVTDLSGISVDGYVISNVGPIRGMIEPLAQAFFFDAVESDDRIVFVARGGASLVTIPQTDLAAHSAGDDPPAPVEITRMEETALPKEIDIAYLARENNYQQGSQRARRLTTRSEVKAQLPFPIVMSDDAARQLADKHLYSGWQERNKVEFYTGRAYAIYEPADVVTVLGHRIRITGKDVGANGVINWQGLIEDTSVYTQTASGVTMISPSNDIPLPPLTDAEFLDIPLLRDADNDPGFYVALAGEDPWRGAQLYQYVNGAYAALAGAEVVSGATIGIATTALGDCTRCGQFDETNSVTVYLTSGSLVSAARADVLAGANAAILGDELIQFRTATLTATDTYRLTGLLRARLGTEWATAAHASGERFVLLNDKIRTITGEWSGVGLAATFKAVTFGRTLTQTNEESFTNTAVRREPLAPIRLAAARDGNGDWQIQWVRRTRLAAPLRDNVDAPLDELTEAYHVDVMNGSAVARTITSTQQNASYTAAQEASDFGSPTPTSLTVNVYQVGDRYGRGRAATGTFS